MRHELSGRMIERSCLHPPSVRPPAPGLGALPENRTIAARWIVHRRLGKEHPTPVLSFAPLLRRDVVHGNTTFTGTRRSREQDRDGLPRAFKRDRVRLL